MADKQKDRPPLEAFVHHQARAVEETGKAFLALLPQGFRDHAEQAIDESKQGFEALFEGVVDTVDAGLDKMRGKDKDTPGKDKVKVEVD